MIHHRVGHWLLVWMKVTREINLRYEIWAQSFATALLNSKNFLRAFIMSVVVFPFSYPLPALMISFSWNSYMFLVNNEKQSLLRIWKTWEKKTGSFQTNQMLYVSVASKIYFNLVEACILILSTKCKLASLFTFVWLNFFLYLFICHSLPNNMDTSGLLVLYLMVHSLF